MLDGKLLVNAIFIFYFLFWGGEPIWLFKKKENLGPIVINIVKNTNFFGIFYYIHFENYVMMNIC